MNAGSPRLQRAFRRAQPWVVHFHVSTPTADYGFVLEESGVTCDVVSQK